MQSLFLTYLLTPCSRALLWNLTSSCINKKFLILYGNWRFITAFTISCHVPVLSQINPVHAISSHFLNIHFNIFFPSTPGSSVVSFPQVSPPKPHNAIPIFNTKAYCLLLKTILNKQTNIYMLHRKSHTKWEIFKCYTLSLNWDFIVIPKFLSPTYTSSQIKLEGTWQIKGMQSP